MMYDLVKTDYIAIAEAFNIPIAFGKQSGVCYRMDKVADLHSEQEYEEFHPYWDSNLILRMLAMLMETRPTAVVNLFASHEEWEDTMNALILKEWLTWTKKDGSS